MKTNSFQTLTSTIKGEYGEHLVESILKAKGYNFATPSHNSAHLCDGFIYKMGQTFELKAFEIKTRPAFNLFDSQGLDLNKILAYNYVASIMPMLFFFIDENKGEILWSTYEKMNEETTQIEKNGKSVTYPNSVIMNKQGIRMYTTRTMNKLCNLLPEQIEAIRSLSKRNYAYTSTASARWWL